jgi:Uncharacterized protein conserved in bacteria (DUF2334)
MKREPDGAQYLLRFDDLCPTMDRERWERFRVLIERFGVRPILAVIPDNCDPELERDLPNPGFWEEMRAREAAGATIGLHGYRHVCTETGRSLIPGRGETEFAGASLDLQREWVEAGLGMLRARGLRPLIFVAPRHGLDLVTVRVLREEGIGLVSDGFAERPYRDHGVIWIPQQIWGPVEQASGLWTICMHSNSATDEDAVALERFLEQFSSRFTSVDRALAEWPISERSIGDRWFHGRMVWRNRLSQFRRGLLA